MCFGSGVSAAVSQGAEAFKTGFSAYCGFFSVYSFHKSVSEILRVRLFCKLWASLFIC